MAKRKLPASYLLSDKAREALFEGDLSAAAQSRTVGGGYTRMKRNRTEVNTVEDAARVSKGLSEVNRKLRSARRPQGE